MERNHLFGLVALVALLNGVLNPFVVWFFTQAATVLLAWAAPPISLIIYFAYLLGATFTLTLAGIPAALYERITGREDSDLISVVIWLAAAVLLSLPALRGLAGLL